MSLFTELKRRNVFRVAAAYIIVGWMLLQVSDTLVPALQLPEIFNSAVAFILIIGFPIALILAWAYEITPEGLKKEIDVDRSQSITDRTGRKLDFTIIAVLAVATVLKCHALVLVQQERISEALAVAQQALGAGLDDRWFSKQVFLRLVRDGAFQTGDLDTARQWYLNIHPKLFEECPFINVDNIYAAADLALLLQQSGEAERAGVLIQEGLAWYQQTQRATMHGYVTTIVDVSLLALSGDDELAMEALSPAADEGWKYDWRWHLGNKNLDSIRGEPGFEEIESRLERETALQLAAIRSLPDMGEFDLRSS